jgi:predicted metallo-beta-lactamase superfamily hydrolase
MMRLRKIRVTPLAFESLGVRSMCTYVETSDVRVLIDPGVSLGQRFSILPHPKEYKARSECRTAVSEAAKRADLIAISHYHYDHHTPNFVDTVWNGSSPEEAEKIYGDKIVLAKDFKSFINFSQRRRGWMFQKISSNFVKRFEIADGRTFEYGGTRLRFSKPVFHGEEDSALGWVLMLTVESNEEKFMYAPDVQGPISNGTCKLILSENPDLLIIGGPPLYLAGFKVKEEAIAHGLENLVKIAESVPVIVLEHHLLRAENWREYAEPAFEAARRTGHKVVSAAEFLGKQNNLLECKRRKLYEGEPPTEEFLRWMKLPKSEQSHVPPPV